MSKQEKYICDDCNIEMEWIWDYEEVDDIWDEMLYFDVYKCPNCQEIQTEITGSVPMAELCDDEHDD